MENVDEQGDEFLFVQSIIKKQSYTKIMMVVKKNDNALLMRKYL